MNDKMITFWRSRCVVDKPKKQVELSKRKNKKKCIIYFKILLKVNFDLNLQLTNKKIEDDNKIEKHF